MSEENESPESVSPFLRFSDIVETELLAALRVTIIGAGGIGAPAALALAKTGVSQLTIYDHDVVGDENLGPQMYGPGTVGQPKVVALRRFLKAQAPWTEVVGRRELYTGEPLDADVVIAAVDSLTARQHIWTGAQASEATQLVVDPRMGAEVLTLLLPQPTGVGDEDWYAETLEGPAVEGTCTAKATFYTGLIAGGFCAQALKAFVGGELDMAEYTLDMRYLQFFSFTRDEKAEMVAQREAFAAEAKAS